MGPMGVEVHRLISRYEEAKFCSQQVTVTPYDPLSQGEQVYLGSIDIELSFTKPNYRTDFEFDSDDLAKFFITVPILPEID
jgi:hypothetical protein